MKRRLLASPCRPEIQTEICCFYRKNDLNLETEGFYESSRDRYVPSSSPTNSFVPPSCRKLMPKNPKPSTCLSTSMSDVQPSFRSLLSPRSSAFKSTRSQIWTLQIGVAWTYDSVPHGRCSEGRCHPPFLLCTTWSCV